MQRGWQSDIGRARPRIEMVGGDFLSRPGPCMGCSAWDDDDDRTLHVSDRFTVHHRESCTVYTAIGICHTGYSD